MDNSWNLPVAEVKERAIKAMIKRIERGNENMTLSAAMGPAKLA